MLYEKRLLAGMAAAALVCTPALAGTSQNLLQNSSFELPRLAPGAYQGFGSNTVHHWVWPGSVLINAADPAPGGSPWWPDSPCPSGYVGLQFAGLQGHDELQQDFTVPTAGDYVVRWLAAGRPASGSVRGDQRYYVYIDFDIFKIKKFSTTSGEPFTRQRLTLRGLGAGPHVIIFVGLSYNRDNTAFLDDVRITPLKY